MSECIPFTVDSIPITSPYCTAPLRPNQVETLQDSENGIIVCTICNVKCCGRVPYEQHLHGASHRKQVQMKDTQLVCTLCDLTFTSPDHLEGHLNGQKHKRKLKLSTSKPLCGSVVTSSTDSPAPIINEPLAKVPPDDQFFHCLACDLVCSSSTQLTTHLNGKRHAKKCKLQAEYWLDVTQTKAVNKVNANKASATKASKRRTFFRLPKNHPETSPETLLEMENALPLVHNPDDISNLPFCFLAGRSQATDDEPDAKRSRLSPELANQPEDGGLKQQCEVTEINTRFCGHLNCVLGRAAKLYQLTLEGILGPSYLPPSQSKSEIEGDLGSTVKSENTS